MITRRTLLAVAVATVPLPALSQGFNRPIRAIVPFPPGGGVDAFARAFVPALSAQLGQSVVIENIGGASSRLGTAAVLRAAPDGHTLLITNDTLAAIEALPVAGSGPFIAGLAPVLLAASAPQALVTHPRSGIADAAAYAARLRAGRPTNIGVPGLGSSQHFASELLAQALGGGPEHVSYRGGGPLLIDLLGGTIDGGVVTLGAAIDQIRDGRLVALGVSGPSRSPALPQAPTFAESVAPGFEVETWMGVLAPRATPAPVIVALHAASLAALRDAGVAQRLGALGFDTPGHGPDRFGPLLRDTAARFAAVAGAVGLRAGEA
ncbi:twin-arginine translocation pathway signal protein [Roseomonas stagni]|uniref:Twin-arginine translocation pathway signal protein n=1 Tax=Falsiroseomonas algicola TaxID=2716930 RepID=A0A6M1LU45_9PROT|nr:tripartite tricarboxylate transporter substrate-binding protein [Falsiroseomonas algicola]NGM24005.1 twin-arginine translocation pathway signal protein [Falsiroseomonas algicola]